MYYITETEQELIKYEVQINQEKLEKLKKELIENCSKINHIKKIEEVNANYNPYSNPNISIKNYISKKVGTKEYDDGSSNDIFEVEYYEYEHPELVIKINRLLNGDAKVIKEIKKYFGSEVPTNIVEKKIESEIQQVKKEINKHLSEISLIKLEELLSLLKNEYNQLEINKNQTSDIEYYKEVMSCIKLIEVSRISKDIQKQVEDFYEETSEKVKKKGEM